MFLGVGNLINPAAIQLTKANAYQAARTVLGLNAPTTTLLSIAEKYTNSVIPQANRALSVQQVLGDVNFSRFVSEGQDTAKPDKLEKILNGVSGGSYGLMDSAFFGIPNWALYGGVGFLAYRYYKKKGFKFGTTAATATTTPTVKV